MRGISGGGVAAISAPCCPYICHWGEDLPFFPPLPLECCPLGGAAGGAGWAGLAATIPHTPPRWPMAAHNASTTRKAHGVPG